MHCWVLFLSKTRVFSLLVFRKVFWQRTRKAYILPSKWRARNEFVEYLRRLKLAILVSCVFSFVNMLFLACCLNLDSNTTIHHIYSHTYVIARYKYGKFPPQKGKMTLTTGLQCYINLFFNQWAIMPGQISYNIIYILYDQYLISFWPLGSLKTRTKTTFKSKKSLNKIQFILTTTSLLNIHVLLTTDITLSWILLNQV